MSIDLEVLRLANTRKRKWQDADPKSRSTIVVATATDNVHMTPDALEIVYEAYKDIDKLNPGNTFTVSLDHKQYAFTKETFEVFVADVLEAIGPQEEGDPSTSTILVTTNVDVVASIDAGTNTFEVNGDAITVTAALGALEFDDESSGTINFYADDSGSPDMASEKTLTDVLVNGDHVIVTAEDGVTTGTYVVSGADAVLSTSTTLVTTNVDVVTSIDAGTNDFVVNGTAIDVTAALGAIEFDDASAGTINFYADDSGHPDMAAEKTLTDVLVNGDHVIATAEDGVTTGTYVVSGAV